MHCMYLKFNLLQCVKTVILQLDFHFQLVRQPVTFFVWPKNCIHRALRWHTAMHRSSYHQLQVALHQNTALTGSPGGRMDN